MSSTDVLSKSPYISFATFRKSGVMVNTPVWVAPADNRLYVFSESKAGKVKRLGDFFVRLNGRINRRAYIEFKIL